MIKTMLPGNAGALECLIETPQDDSCKLVGIICHPHPLHEGTMHNKVVTTLAKVFLHLGAIAVRFNFRGVGQSEGQHDYSVGELDDLRTVISWVKTQYPGYGLLLAGFSFGAYIATKVAIEESPMALITVAPAVHHQDYQSLPEITFPWIVVQGEADEVVPPEQVFAWLVSRQRQPEVLRFPGVSHFFHGQLILLREELLAKLKSVVNC